MVSTADSMIGYDNDSYRHFGRAAAKTDDFLNWLTCPPNGFVIPCGGVPLSFRATGILSAVMRHSIALETRAGLKRLSPPKLESLLQGHAATKANGQAMVL